MTIEPQRVRDALRSAHGDDAYRRFVLELLGPCQRLGRLRWWQEEMWEPVRAALGLEPPDFAALTALFCHCPVHGPDLQFDPVPIAYGTFAALSKGDREKAARLFPLANTRAYGPCWGGEAKRLEVFCCADCRVALRDWQAHREG